MKSPRWLCLVSICIFLAGCSLPGASQATVTAPPAPEIRQIAGHLRNQIELLEELLPAAASEVYVIPTEKEQAAFAELVSALQTDNAARAAQLALENHYELLRYSDLDDNKAESYLLRELKPIQKGWGLYLFRVGGTAPGPILVEAPHPIADAGTPLVAVHLYQALHLQALLIAGAHRDANADGSADVAHAAQSIFQSIHAALLKPTKNAIVLQIHGFDGSKHPDYPQVVLGFDRIFTGSKTNPADDQKNMLAQKIGSALTAQQISVGICDGKLWKDLCGVTTVQADSLSGEIFIHLEMDSSLRPNDKLFIAALKRVFLSQP